ncbi:MAG TPA: class I SAM-dependent methyltransferase [Thermoanaerobaculia bacterium]|nr:class I SAM-dependent methyltransferase [Thermoanaerobaculia bacterium]
MTTYEDHYSGHAQAYARHRPRYPAQLFDWLASVAPGRVLAWDVGTGNGQVAVGLAEHFVRVVATDASGDQLARAVAHERVTYRNEHAGGVSLPDGSVDLVTAGAAAHWFELESFYAEVRRVARSGAVVALFSYGPRDIADAVGPVMHRFHDEVLAGFWPERIRYVHDRYATLPFPFDEIAAPPLLMTGTWSLHDLMALLDTWSASQRYLQQHGKRAVDEIFGELAAAWGDADQRRELRWPLFVRAGRV